jgi:acylphosphatase
MNERLEAIVSGRVQMVMYRDFVARKARGLGLVGEVKNLPDGTVHVVAEGSHEKLERLVEFLHKGSILARVESVTSAYATPENAYTDFHISYE